MDLNTLETFLAVAAVGSFAAVARTANLDPSAVSRTVAALESELGVKLFNRTTRRLELTEAGRLFRDRVDRVVEELTNAQDEVRRLGTGIAGTLRMTTTVAFGIVRIAPLLSRFKDAFPLVMLDLVLSDANLDLVGERIDIAIRMGGAPNEGPDVEPLFPIHHIVCASAAHVHERGRCEAPADIRRYTCLTFNLPSIGTRWRFHDSTHHETLVPIQSAFACSSGFLLKQLVLEGKGIALLPDWLVESELEQGTLVDLFPAHDVTASEFGLAARLIYGVSGHVPGKVKAMKDFLHTNLGRPMTEGYASRAQRLSGA